ncbi:MAG TPA: hypothetical protein VM871_09225 [Flavisolibacter sp.]|nr:hypothetical protein [Flavisolibacter sp.]
MKINFFNAASPLFPFRWYLLLMLILAGTLGYANLSGWRIFSGGQQQWNASGPGGYHK